MENPFHYGSVVTGDDFVDREKELEMLARDLRSNQRILLYSNRRMGKSSLLRELARRYKKEMIFAHLDLYGIQSRDRFLEKVVGEVSRATFTDFEKLISAVSDLIKGTRFRFVITSTGQPPRMTMYKPGKQAARKTAMVAASIVDGATSPACVTRTGPNRSLWSTPLT